MKDNNRSAFNKSMNVYDTDKLTNFESAIIKRFFKGKRVLDVGCGCGRTTINLHNKGFKVIGIDYAEKLINRAKEKYPCIPFKLMDATKLKFKKNSFDIVFFSYNGIDYLFPHKKRIEFLKKANKILKKKGILIYSSHKKFYLKNPLCKKYPFIDIHYLLSMVLRFFSYNNFKYEYHPFGWVKVYCKNDSSFEPKIAGFTKVRRISQGYTSHYICYKK